MYVIMYMYVCRIQKDSLPESFWCFELIIRPSVDENILPIQRGKLSL